jgi:hypothetical protein
VKSYRLPTADAGVIGQGKSADVLPVAHFRAQERPTVPPPLPVETRLHQEPDDLDSASSSHGGDEFEWVPEIAAAQIPGTTGSSYRDEWTSKTALPPAELREDLIDLRCARCTEGDDDMAEIVSGMDDALLAYADKMLIDDPVWDRLRAVRQAMVEVL